MLRKSGDHKPTIYDTTASSALHDDPRKPWLAVGAVLFTVLTLLVCCASIFLRPLVEPVLQPFPVRGFPPILLIIDAFGLLATVLSGLALHHYQRYGSSKGMERLAITSLLIGGTMFAICTIDLLIVVWFLLSCGPMGCFPQGLRQ